MVMSSKKIGKMVGADVGKALANISATTKPDMKGGDEEFKKATGPSRDLTRGEAFKLARMKAKLAGEDPSKATFTWGGKTYHTRMAGEGGSKAATPKASAPKAATPKASSSSVVGDYYRNQFAKDKVSGDASKIKGVSAAESAAAQAKAGKSNVASKPPERSDGTISRINAGWAANKENFAKRQEKKYGPSSSKGDGMFSGINAAWARTKDKFTKAQKAKGYAKGGSVDGIAIRGKTRAPMKKGK